MKCPGTNSNLRVLRISGIFLNFQIQFNQTKNDNIENVMRKSGGELLPVPDPSPYSHNNKIVIFHLDFLRHSNHFDCSAFHSFDVFTISFRELPTQSYQQHFSLASLCCRLFNNGIDKFLITHLERAIPSERLAQLSDSAQLN